ncbi:MAG TPA: AMP-binding protein [Acidimicrobiales bacterium]|nr:AMP-binding protein [Acidimicrobiales bacterium]
MPGPSTLASRIEAASGSNASVTFVSPAGADQVPFGLLHEEARRMGAALQRRGVWQGSHVALLGPTTRPLYTAIEAIWLTGATLIVLPLPMRLGSIEEFAVQTRRRIASADVDLLIVDPDLAPFIEPQPGDPPMVGFDELSGDVERLHIVSADFDRPKDDPDALAVLQFTSGSTADPKGVMMVNRTICANLDAIHVAAEVDTADDVMVSWLPLYHDMGLVGFCMLPLSSGIDVVIGAPQDFLGAPLRWLEWLSAYGGTATAGPNFSWVLATRALRNASGLDLSRLRIALNGAEPVDPDTVENFVAAAAPFGMRPGAVFPAFGMAELMIAGTFPKPLAGLRTDDVDRRVLETERYAAPAPADAEGTRRLALLGPPVPGVEIRVVDPETGSPRLDREVGELEIRGTSVTPGYYGRPDLTTDLFHDGWLRTGDLAYLLEGELVMCGRIKDVIIVGGRNVFPEDVERAASTSDGVRAGNVIAFGVDSNGKEGVVVVAETKGDDHSSTRRSVSQRVRAAIGLSPKDVVLVAPGTLPKTSSGKLQRSLCRERYLGEELEPV